MESQKELLNKLPNELENELHAVRQKSSILDVKSRLPKSTGWMSRVDEVLKPHKEARQYNVGDMVLVDQRNLAIPTGKRGLSYRWIGHSR